MVGLADQRPVGRRAPPWLYVLAIHRPKNVVGISNTRIAMAQASPRSVKQAAASRSTSQAIARVTAERTRPGDGWMIALTHCEETKNPTIAMMKYHRQGPSRWKSHNLSPAQCGQRGQQDDAR